MTKILSKAQVHFSKFLTQLIKKDSIATKWLSYSKDFILIFFVVVSEFQAKQAILEMDATRKYQFLN